jgi:hypothetical protein
MRIGLSFTTSGNRPRVAHQPAHLRRGQSSMAQGILLRSAELCNAGTERVDPDQRVVAEATLASRSGKQLGLPRPKAISGSGSAWRNATSVLTARTRRSVWPTCSADGVGGVLGSPPGLAVAGCNKLAGVVCRLNTWRTTQRRSAQARVVGHCRQPTRPSGVARLGQCILDKAEVRLVGLGDAQ